MKYLRKFTDHSEYEVFKNSENYILPNISYCVQQKECHMKPKPNTNNYEYVDMGNLGIWATCDLGSISSTSYGQYVQWGDIQRYSEDQVGSGENKKYFSWNDYKFTTDGGTTFSKYNSFDTKMTLDLEDDIAHVVMGGDWRMPTYQEFRDLVNGCNFAKTLNYTSLTLKTNPTKILFFPLIGGIASQGNFTNKNYAHCMWTSSLSVENSGIAVDFNSYGLNPAAINRCKGCFIRAIIK